jgi:putative ABC transport system permease protein
MQDGAHHRSHVGPVVLRLVAAQFRSRPGRSLALAVGIVVSSVAFVLLIGSARSGELKVQGSVQSNFRPAYDVLVRPKGSRTQLERSRGLVRDNYLSGIFGGITLRQWRQIERLPGVAVAAPIANIGYTAGKAHVSVPLDRYVTNAAVQMLRLRSTYVTPDGSRYPTATGYVYVTRDGVFNNDKSAIQQGRLGQFEHGHLVRPCAGFTTPAPPPGAGPFASGFKGPFEAQLFPYITCFSTRTGRPEILGGYPKRYVQHVQLTASATFPILLAAIDPVQEAKLVSLDQAVTSGRYLRPNERPSIQTRIDPFFHDKSGNRYVPVLAASRTFVGDEFETQVDRLRVPSGIDVADALSSGSCVIAFQPCPSGSVDLPPLGSRFRTGLEFAQSLKGTPAGRQRVAFQAIYRQFLTGYAATQRNALASTEYWAVSDVRYRRPTTGALIPLKVSNPLSAYGTNFGAVGALPWDNKDVQFRRLSERLGNNGFDQKTDVLNTPFLRVIGRYDPSKLPGFSPLSRVPLETYYPPLLAAADAASEKALKGRRLSPTQNLGDYIQQPPLYLTTISSLPAFLDGRYWQGVPAAQRSAPISAIRVRVDGVSGADSRSVARIDSVALRIHELTGLDVDITAGSSPHSLTVELPAGKFGRPPLTLNEGWSKKGVSLSFLHGIDRKRLALFALIPVLCCLFLGNGVFAAARARRSEIGALLTLGWGRAAIFRLLLGEILFVGLFAGLIGVGAATALNALLQLKASALSTALVLPTALALAALAGLMPALRGSAGSPLDALRPPVVDGKRGGRVNGLLELAFVNLRRMPGRALLGSLGLAVGAAALTFLIAVERAFSGVLAGTVLGDAISVQIRGFDYLAVGLVIGLATLSVADVLYLNLRERQAELVTLRTLGWQQRHLVQVVLAEALTLGLSAAALGSLAGVAIGWLVLAAPFVPVCEGAAAAMVGGVVAAAVASLLPLSQIGRLTPPGVLAAEH